MPKAGIDKVAVFGVVKIKLGAGAQRTDTGAAMGKRARGDAPDGADTKGTPPPTLVVITVMFASRPTSTRYKGE
jgi:hypothetical protein